MPHYFTELSHYEYSDWMMLNGEAAAIHQVKGSADAYWALVKARGDRIYSPTHSSLLDLHAYYLAHPELLR